MKSIKNLFEIEYKKKFPFVYTSSKNLFAIFFEAVLLGFLAFIMETMVDIVYQQRLIDQGTLSGPFIPMYAIVLFFGLLLIKMPERNFKNCAITFLALFIGITVIEYIVGNILEAMLHEVLWCYDDMIPLSYGYISLPVSVFWGMGGVLYYYFFVPLVKKIPDLIKSNLDRYMIMATFLFIFLIDVFFSFRRYFKSDGYQMIYDCPFTFDLALFIVCIFLYIIAAFILGFALHKVLKPIIKEKGKWPFIYIYGIILTLPAFSAYNYLNRKTGFIETLAIMGFLSCGFMIYFLLSLIVLFVIRIIVAKASKKELFKSSLVKTINVFSSVFLSIIICIIGVISLKNPETVVISAGSGDNTLNIVAVSDLHYGTTGGIVKLSDCVKDINKKNPDIVVFLGDTIDIDVKRIDREYFFSEMSKINSTYGVYAIGGNHEYENNSYMAIDSFFEGSPVKLLLDDEVFIDGKVRIIGREDYVFSDSRLSISEIEAKSSNPTSTLPLIVLSHQPQDYRDSVKANAVLQLSGHIHNGQLFPGNLFVGLYHKIAFKSDLVDGMYKKGNTKIYVTRGYGAWGFPMRTSGRSQIIKVKFKY